MWERIVLNLVSNAVKYTFAGSITVRLSSEAGAAVLSVVDTGIGIAPDDLAQVFDRFHRIESAEARSRRAPASASRWCRSWSRCTGAA